MAIGRAEEIKTASIKTIGNVGQTINNWLEKNKDLTIIDIKISESKKRDDNPYNIPGQ
ncbi:hypothetical protein SPD48_09665 [Pseudogracilibacillus sp. SE30717A]|uniref:hypothetical protein n=1 Tax=Pseudogracilibacillus sp. SE30717A TaxID=3098293 RepID=UPI00300E4064